MKFKINKELVPIKAHFFFFFAALGPVLPQLNVFGRQLGVSPAAMGLVTAVLPLLWALAKPLFGYVVDFWPAHRKLVFMMLISLMTGSYCCLWFLPMPEAPDPTEPSIIEYIYNLNDTIYLKKIDDPPLNNVEKYSCHWNCSTDVKFDVYLTNSSYINTIYVDVDVKNDSCSLFHMELDGVREGEVVCLPKDGCNLLCYEDALYDLNKTDTILNRTKRATDSNVSDNQIGEKDKKNDNLKGVLDINDDKITNDVDETKHNHVNAEINKTNDKAVDKTNDNQGVAVVRTNDNNIATEKHQINDATGKETDDHKATKNKTNHSQDVKVQETNDSYNAEVDKTNETRTTVDLNKETEKTNQDSKVNDSYNAQVDKTNDSHTSEIDKANETSTAVDINKAVDKTNETHIAVDINKVNISEKDVRSKVKLPPRSAVDAPVEDGSFYMTAAFWGFVVLMCVGTVAFNVANCIGDAVCFDVLGPEGGSKYGAQRAWGTAGYGLTALAGGWLVDAVSTSGYKDFTPAFIIALAATAVDLYSCRALTLPSLSSPQDSGKALREVLKIPRVLVFITFAVVAGTFDSFIIYYMFWFLEEVAEVTGHTARIKFIEGVVVAGQSFVGELLCFFFSGKILKRWGFGATLTFSLLCYGVRMALISFITNPWHLVFIESIMQGPTYALCYSTIVGYAAHVAPPGYSATVQGIVAGMDDGLGFAIGSLLGGLLYSQVGGRAAFQIFAGVAVLGSILHAALFALVTRTDEQKAEVSIDLEEDEKMLPQLHTTAIYQDTVEPLKEGERYL